MYNKINNVIKIIIKVHHLKRYQKYLKYHYMKMGASHTVQHIVECGMQELVITTRLEQNNVFIALYVRVCYISNNLYIRSCVFS